jgi:hypothetical protein
MATVKWDARVNFPISPLFPFSASSLSTLQGEVEDRQPKAVIVHLPFSCNAEANPVPTEG